MYNSHQQKSESTNSSAEHSGKKAISLPAPGAEFLRLSSESSSISNPSITQNVIQADFRFDNKLKIFVDEETGMIYKFVSQTGSHIVVKRETDGYIVHLNYDQKNNTLKVVGTESEEEEEIRLGQEKYELPDDLYEEEMNESGEDNTELNQDKKSKSDSSTDIIEEFENLPMKFEKDENPSTFLTVKKRKPGEKKDEDEINFRSGFISHVSLVPIAQGEQDQLQFDDNYTAEQLFITKILLSDSDRPNTKFGEKQKSHTVAWTLLRNAITSFAGNTLSLLIKYINNELIFLNSIEQNEKTKRLMQGFKPETMPPVNQPMPIYLWQLTITEYLRIYFHIYQLSDSATYNKKAKGNAEADSMKNLRYTEEQLKENPQLDIKNQLPLLKGYCEKLLDVQFGLALHEIDYVFSVQHWMNSLILAFPYLFHKTGNTLFQGVLDKNLSPGVSKKYDIKKKTVLGLLEYFEFNKHHVTPGVNLPNELIQGNEGAQFELIIPPEIDSNFICNIIVAPNKKSDKKRGGMKIQEKKQINPHEINLKIFSPADLYIFSISLSDTDRASTKFLTRQLSHTVAWTLIRKAFMEEKGNSLMALLHKMFGLLSSLKISNKNGESLRQKAIQQIIGISKAEFPLHLWTNLLTNLARAYVIAYQVSDSASFGKEAKGRAEGSHKDTLNFNEYHLYESGKLADDEEIVIDAAIGLFDGEMDVGNLSVDQFVSSVLHWIEHLRYAYPLIMSLGETIIFETMGKRDLPEQVAEDYKVDNVLELINLLGSKHNSPLDELGVESKSKLELKKSPVSHLVELGYGFNAMSGYGNDCALNTIFHQLVHRHKLSLNDLKGFKNYIRHHAGFAFGSMIDILNNGSQLLEAVRNYLVYAKVINQPGDVQLSINLWSAVEGSSLMQFNDVARTGDGNKKMVLVFYFNGVNHFDSLLGGPDI
ncbi:MAG: hypothetical protein MUC87_06790 [Bacteroidia bacterium]|jgi:hypothetical protein|nr:hypothetical protein [Bacteroidia bacterium]